jgi:hypothetical protein
LRASALRVAELAARSVGWMAGALLLAVLVAAAPAQAQSSDSDPLVSRSLPFTIVELMPDAPVVVLSLEDMEALEAWTRDFAAWQQAVERWRRQKLPISWNQFLDHSPKPAPPSWLGGVCPLVEDDAEFTDACGLLADWREDPLTAKTRHTTAAALQQREAPKNSFWWRNLHLDGLWSTTQSNIAAIGLFGTHLTVSVEGRLQVFVAPGVMLVSVPNPYGPRVLSPATDWGLTYRLFNAGGATVHFNLVHAWIFGSAAQIQGTNLTLGGFSLTRRVRPR